MTTTLASETQKTDWTLIGFKASLITLITAVVFGFIWAGTTGNWWIIAGIIIAVISIVFVGESRDWSYSYFNHSSSTSTETLWTIVLGTSAVIVFLTSGIICSDDSVYLVDRKEILRGGSWRMPFSHSIVALTSVEDALFEAEAETADHKIVACIIDCRLPLGNDLSKLTTDRKMRWQAQGLLHDSFKRIVSRMTLDELHNPLVVEDRLFRETDLAPTGLQWGDVVKVTGLHVAAKLPELPKGSEK